MQITEMVIEHMRIALSLKKTLFLKNSITSRKLNCKDLHLDIITISLLFRVNRYLNQTSGPKKTLLTDILSTTPEPMIGLQTTERK